MEESITTAAQNTGLRVVVTNANKRLCGCLYKTETMKVKVLLLEHGCMSINHLGVKDKESEVL